MSLRLRITYFVLLLIISTLQSCELFQPTQEAKQIARVHDVILYDYDLKNFNIPEGLSEKDSIAVLIDHINDWATKQLILLESKKNLTEKKQIEYNNLVEEYRLDLFSSAYENAYVIKNLNKKISDKEINTYFDQYKQSFVLQEDLVQFRYIKLPENYKNLRATVKALKRFNNEDIDELEKLIPSYDKSNFNLQKDWIAYETLLEEIPSLKFFKKNKILKNNNFLNYKSEESRYLIFIDSVLKMGQTAPLSYVKERIEQILLNKRKIKLKKQLEKEIREDALQNKEYQIFE